MRKSRNALRRRQFIFGQAYAGLPLQKPTEFRLVIYYKEEDLTHNLCMY